MDAETDEGPIYMNSKERFTASSIQPLPKLATSYVSEKLSDNWLVFKISMKVEVAVLGSRP